MSSEHGPAAVPAEAWKAVIERDPQYDGAFVYAVTSTGIYCRPVCRARRPRRDNVRFFASGPEAEAQGYRACRRCRPDAPGATAIARAVERARSHLERNVAARVTLAELGAIVHVSPYHLQRSFKRLLGVTPREYQARRRGEALREALQESGTLTSGGHAAGFATPKALYTAGVEGLGMTPGEYRRGGAGVVVRHATAATRFGTVLVAFAPRGICRITLGDEPSALLLELRRELPSARLEEAGEGEAELLRTVVAVVEEGTPAGDLPLDVVGTAFQLRVWKALRQVPRGTTVTYTELAERVGSPRAVRAVGRACGANPLAVLVPCHRVLRSDGGAGGYRWGVERKLALLAAEREPAPDGAGGAA